VNRIADRGDQSRLADPPSDHVATISLLYLNNSNTCSDSLPHDISYRRNITDGQSYRWPQEVTLSTQYSQKSGRGRIWAVAIGVGVVGALMVGVIAASTAGNTVEESRAGIGTGKVTGYDVSSLSYTLNTSDPSLVDAVTFALDEAPTKGSTIQVRLSDGSPTWYDCSFSDKSVTCPTTSTPASVADITALTVVAAQ